MEKQPKHTHKQKGASITEYAEALFLLKSSYEKLLQILEGILGNGAVFRNRGLGNLYVVTKGIADNILKLKEFKDLRNEAPELYENIVGDLESMSDEWPYFSHSAYEFLQKIDAKYIYAGSPKIDLPKSIKEMFKLIDTETKKQQDQAAKRLKSMVSTVQAHAKLLPKTEKIKISITAKRGITRRSGGQLLIYPIQGKGRLLVSSLISGPKPGRFFTGLLQGDYKTVNRIKRDVNRIFKNSLQIQYPIILSNRATGYELNHDKFDISLE